MTLHLRKSYGIFVRNMQKTEPFMYHLFEPSQIWKRT